VRPILSLRKDAAAETGPAAAAFEANRRHAAELATALGEKQELYVAIVAALASAEAKVAAVSHLREQLASAEADLQATTELGRAPVDATPLASLQQELAAAEREAATAAPRVRVEAAKRGKLAAEITRLHEAQHAVHAQHLPLLTEMLWELLNTQISAYTAVREAFLVQFDQVFTTASAIDKIAQDTKSGRFAGSGAMTDLVIPVPVGMAPFGFTLKEHWDRVQGGAVELLRSLGLHS